MFLSSCKFDKRKRGIDRTIEEVERDSLLWALYLKLRSLKLNANWVFFLVSAGSEWLQARCQRRRRRDFSSNGSEPPLVLWFWVFLELEDWSSVRFHLRMMMMELMCWAMRTQEGKVWGACQWLKKPSGCSLGKKNKSSWSEQFCRYAQTCQSHIADTGSIVTTELFL